MLLSMKELFEKYKLNDINVLHIGAHQGQEAESYKELGIKNVLFFEPCKANYEICKARVEPMGYKAFNIGLGNEKGEKQMFTETANSGMSSSLLMPKIHLLQHAGIIFDGQETVTITTLDDVLEGQDHSFNFINMDVQGYELEVLKGATKTLEKIEHIYCEINRHEMYENCAMIDDLDLFLNKYNMQRLETRWFGDLGWGDGFYSNKCVN